MTFTEGQEREREKKNRHLCLEKRKWQKDKMNRRRKKGSFGKRERKGGRDGLKEQGHVEKEKEARFKKKE